MDTRLIQLDDGTLIEVNASPDEATDISSRFAEKVDSTFDKIKPMLMNVCRPIASVWKEVNKEMQAEQAEIELGLSFEGEGNLFVTRSKASANLPIRLIVKPKDPE